MSLAIKPFNKGFLNIWGIRRNAHLETTNQEVAGSNPAGRARGTVKFQVRCLAVPFLIVTFQYCRRSTFTGKIV